MTMIRTLLAAAALALAVPSGALAKSPAYVGTWASEAAQCKAGQEMENAPMVMQARRYDQHETHCTFASVTARGATWAVKARCQVEGDTQRLNFTLAVSGNTLTMKEGGGTRTLQRCP